MDLGLLIAYRPLGIQDFYGEPREWGDIDAVWVVTKDSTYVGKDSVHNRLLTSGPARRAFAGTWDVMEPLCRQAVNGELPWMPVFIICSASGPEDFLESARKNHYPCAVLLSDRPLWEAVNAAENVLGIYRVWQRSFVGRRRGSRPRALAETCWELSACPVAILGKDYRLLAWCGLENGEYYGSASLLSKGGMEAQELADLRNHPDAAVQNIRVGVSTVGCIILWRPPEMEFYDYCLPVMADNLSDWMKTSGRFSSMGLSDRRLVFERFIYDLLEGDFREGKEGADERLLRVAEKNGFWGDPYFVCGVFKYREENNQPLNPCIYQLKQRYPQGDFAIYRRSIVALIPVKRRDPKELKLAALEEYLESRNLVAGISGAGRHMDYFYTFYLMAAEALKLGEKNGTSRVCYFEDFRMTYMLDLCRSAFAQRTGHERQIYLCHPAVLDLGNYDREHHTDLFKVLYTYLKCCKNLARTGRALNYHRNTIMNKISRIEAITGLSLDEDEIYPILLFSCMMYERLGL